MCVFGLSDDDLPHHHFMVCAQTRETWFDGKIRTENRPLKMEHAGQRAEGKTMLTQAK